MAHHCVDWTAKPPSRKTSLLILTWGDDHVYTTVPKDLQTLEEIARSEFDLGDVDLSFSTSCVNLCHGQPARITERAWEHLSPYIGCATVETSGPRNRARQDGLRKEPPTASEMTEEHDAGAKRKLPSDTDKGHENERGDGRLGTLARETVRDEQDTNATSDHGNDRNGTFAPQDDQRDEPWEEEEVSAIIPPQRSRIRRRVASEDEEESEREHQEESPAGHDDRDLSQSAEHLHRLSSGKSIKQEKHESGNDIQRPQPPHTEPEYDIQTQTQVQVGSGENHKLTIRIAHRPSKQESKFTTKDRTKVSKVLASACRSFGLDPSRATLYLIVSVEFEDGQAENLFPCDKNDTIARAGAERDTESRFLLKMTGEA